MYQIAFHLFGHAIHWYGVCVALGFLTALVLLQYKRNHARMTSDQIFDIALIVVLGGIAGSRIAYVIQFSDQFREHPLNVFRIDQGGLVFYGGFLLALTIILIYSRIKKLSLTRILDICAPAMAGGHAFGRIGCFMQGCCFGKPVPKGLPGVVFPPDSAPAMRYPDLSTLAENMKQGINAASSLPLIPVQLFEAAANVILAIILLLLFKKEKKTGCIASFYFLSYGVLRFLLEFLRGDHTDSISGLTRAQWIGLVVMIPAGLFFYFYFGKHGEDVADEQKH